MQMVFLLPSELKDISAIFWKKNVSDSCSSFENLHNTELKSNGLISFTDEISKEQNTKDLCRATVDFSYGNLQKKMRISPRV